jgi:hypothetical protein
MLGHLAVEILVTGDWGSGVQNLICVTYPRKEYVSHR